MKKKVIRQKKIFFWHTHTLLLFLLCVVLGVSHILYVFKTRQYPEWDEHQYIGLTVQYYDILKHPNVTTWGNILQVSTYRQPVYPLLLTSLLMVFGTDHTYKIALLFNGILYIVTILTVFYLARQFLGKTSSLVAAVIYTFSGNALFFLHFTYSETALTTFVMLTLFFLWKSDDLTRPKESLLAAISFGLSNLVKWSTPAFVFLPVVFVCIRACIKAIKRKEYRMSISLHITLFSMWGVVVPFFVYYLPNLGPFMDYVKRNQNDAPQWVSIYRFPDMANTLSTHSVMYYFNIISQNTVFFLCLFVVGLIIGIIHFRKYAYILLAFLSQYGFLTLFTVWKEDRYAVSMYPLIGITSAIVIEHISNKKIRIAVIAVTIVLSLFNFLGASWGMGPMGKRGLTDIVLPAFIHHPRRIYLTPLVWAPTKEYVNAHELFDIVRSRTDKEHKPTVIQFFTFEPWDNAVYSLLTYQQRNLFTVKHLDEKDLTDVHALSGILQNGDYVLTKNMDVSDMVITHVVLLKQIFVPIDKSTVYVYKIV